MNPSMLAQIKELSTEGLQLLYNDCINRIGSHSLGLEEKDEYILKQEAIINAIQEEFKNRKDEK
jgi:hypothetical protein